MSERHLLDPTQEPAKSRGTERGRLTWCASTSSRSAKSVDSEWEEVGIAWARVEWRGSEANVNSHRVPFKGSTNSTKEIIGTRHALQPVVVGTAHLVYTGAAVG